MTAPSESLAPVSGATCLAPREAVPPARAASMREAIGSFDPRFAAALRTISPAPASVRRVNPESSTDGNGAEDKASSSSARG